MSVTVLRVTVRVGICMQHSVARGCTKLMTFAASVPSIEAKEPA